MSECAADGDDRLQRPAPMSGMSESSAAEPPAQPGRRDGERPRGEERPRGVVPRAAAARRSLCPSDRPRLGTLKSAMRADPERLLVRLELVRSAGCFLGELAG